MKFGIKSTLWALFRTLGIDAYSRKPDHHYVPNYFGRSAHKQLDIRAIPVFGKTAWKVIQDGRVTLYYDRLFTIYQILLNRKMNMNDSTQTIHTAEVGVYKGGTSYFIASLADELGIQIQHSGFDTFDGHAVEDINPSVETSHKAHTFSDNSFEAVRDYLKRFGNVSIFKGRFQDTASTIQNTMMDFVHLDMDIYEPTIFALDFFGNRMVKGGVILLDDYGFETCPGIIKAINEFTPVHKDFAGMALLTGQYVLVKL